MTIEPEKRSKRMVGVWLLASVVAASLLANGALTWRIHQLALTCADADAGQARPRLKQPRYELRPLAAPQPAVDVPGLEDLEHKPLMLVFDERPLGPSSPAPTLALYEDGLAVTMRYLHSFEGVEESGAHRPMPLIGHVPAESARRFVRERFAGQFGSVPSEMDVEGGLSFDGPYVHIYLRDGSKWTHTMARNLVPGCFPRCSLPREVQIIYQWAWGVELPDATRWTGTELPSREYILKMRAAVHDARPPRDGEK